jgi:hypothetical protein
MLRKREEGTYVRADLQRKVGVGVGGGHLGNIAKEGRSLDVD